jgi:hypothetical protein
VLCAAATAFRKNTLNEIVSRSFSGTQVEDERRRTCSKHGGDHNRVNPMDDRIKLTAALRM